jgi:hypothetical protein
MNDKRILALVFSAGLMVACGNIPTTSSGSAPSSNAVKTQLIDTDGGGGGGGGGGTGDVLLGYGYPQGTQLAVVPRSGAYETVTLNWRAQGFTYDWYDYPYVELRVCSLDQNGAVVACVAQSSSVRINNSDQFTVSLSCQPSDSVTSFVVYGSDVALHPGGHLIYATSVQALPSLPILPSPLPPTPAPIPVC